MPRTHHNNGFGGVTGDRLATAKPIVTSGDVWYVDSQTGSDTDATGGKDRKKPFATLAKAMTVVSEGDVVILLDGHSEEYDDGGSNITFSLTIVGEGSASGVPTVTLIHKPGANQMFQVTASTAFLNIRNIKFQSGSKAATPGANTVAAVYSVGPTLLDGCRFEADHQSDYAMVHVANMNVQIRNCTFISTAPDATDRPVPALRLGELANTCALVLDTTFDGGTYGWNDSGDPYAAKFATASLSAELFYGEGITLKNGADIFLDPAVKGFAHVGTVSGSGRVVW